MRQTVKNRMIKNVQMMAVGMMATASIMGTAAAMGVKMDNIPFNVLANPFQAVMTQGVAAIELGSSGSCGDNATYELSMDGTLTISGTGALIMGAFNNAYENVKKVIINEGITDTGDYAFTNCQKLESVTLPETLERIGGQAFLNCTSLKQVNIPQSMTLIDYQAFEECSSLESIIIPNSVKTIGNKAFYGCQALKTVRMPDSLDYMGHSIFKDCQSLSGIQIPDGIKTIESNSFENCQNITSITIPDNIERIDYRAFYGCTKLVEINGGKNIAFSINNETFWVEDLTETILNSDNFYLNENTYWWRGDNRIIITSSNECGPDATYKEEDTKVTITGTGAIDDEAFKDKDTVTEVVIDEGITEIGNQSFENMDNLEKVTIPDSVTNIGDQAFAEDPKLEIVQGGDNADIADNAFDCTEPETTIKTDNENIYNNIKDNTDRDVQLQNSVPISPVEENWLYSSDDEAFITDKVQVGSVKDDFESLLDEFATVVGLDEKQGAKQNYETADASNEDTLVYCTKASDWIITIPKDLVMSGDDESRAEYVVGIYGNVDPAKRVTVTPAPSFEMTNTGNAKVKYDAQVNQTVTGINGMDIIESPEADVDDASQMSGTITANLKRAGSYRGTMTFTVDYVDHT